MGFIYVILFIISLDSFLKYVLSVLRDTLIFLASESDYCLDYRKNQVWREELRVTREGFQHIVVSGWMHPDSQWRAWEHSINICVSFARSAVDCSIFCWWLKFEVWKERRADTQYSRALYKCNTQGVLLWFLLNTNVNNWESLDRVRSRSGVCIACTIFKRRVHGTFSCLTME